MAFNIDCQMIGYEVRGVDSGVSKAGKPWRSIRLESLSNGRTCEVSSTDGELFGYIDGLNRGDVVALSVRAVAGRERSYLILLEAPQVTGNSYAGTVS